MVYINVDEKKVGKLFYEKNLNWVLTLNPKLCFCRSHSNMAFYDGYEDEFTGFDINKWYIYLYNANTEETNFCCGFVPLSKLEPIDFPTTTEEEQIDFNCDLEKDSKIDEKLKLWRKNLHCYFIRELVKFYSNTKRYSFYHSPYRLRSKSC